MRRHFRSILMAATFMSAAPTVWALPSPTLNTGHAKPVIQAFAQQDAAKRLDGSLVLLDSDPSAKTVYISPSNRKTQGGIYQQGAPPRCDLVDQMYNLTYLLPSVPPEQWAAFAVANRSFSPFFDMSFGNVVRNANLLQQIADRIGQSQAIREAHAAEYKAYIAAKGVYDHALQGRVDAQAKLDALDGRIDTLLKRMDLATSPDEIAELKTELANARADRAAKLPDLKHAYAKADLAVDDAFTPYNDAKAAWDPYQVDLDQLDKETKAVQDIMATLGKAYADAFQTDLDTLTAFQNAVVGAASAAYSIYDQEVRAAREALANTDASDWLVTTLPLFNVRLQPAHWTGLTASYSPTPGGPVRGAVHGSFEVSNAASSLGSGTAPATGTFTDASGNPMTSTKGNPPVNHVVEGNEGAGTFQTIVSRAAYCAGTTDTPWETFSPTAVGVSSGPPVVDITRPLNTHRSGNVLAQSVALSYDYNEAADPMGVQCDMDTAKFMSFAEGQGDVHFLFWGNKWDDTTRQQSAQSGISCVVTVAPSATGDSAAQQALALAMQQRATQEMAADFLRLFADSYTATPSPADTLLAADRKPGQAIADAMSCNLFTDIFQGCSATKAAWKAADAVFGFREGSRSVKDSISAHLYRNYTIRSFVTQHGSAVIDLTVPVP